MKAINLLPPEAAIRAKARRRRFGLILLGIVYLALLGVGYMFFQGQKAEVEDRLADKQNEISMIQAEIQSLAPARALDRELNEGTAQLATILAADLAWGRLLNDLGRVIPDRVWLESFTASAELDPENPGVFGGVAMNGIAFDYPDAASWLRTLDSDRWPAVGAGWVLSTAQEDVVDGVIAVAFSSIGVLTEAALDDRLIDRIPQVPE